MLVNSFCNITKKSFKKYSLNASLKPVSIIFGTNGSGKTALCNDLVEKYPEQSRLFDDEYVANNIKVEEVKGLSLLAGSSQIQQKQAITDIDKKLQDKEAERKGLEATRSKNRTDLTNILDDAVEDGKKRYKIKTIHKKPKTAKEPEVAYLQWLKEAEQSSYSKANTDIKDLNTELGLLKIKILDLRDPISKDQLNRLNNIPHLLSEKVIKRDSDLSQALSEWLRKGLELHNIENDSETCLFCGNKFNAPLKANEIRERIDSSYATLINELDSLLKLLNNLITGINKIAEIDTELSPDSNTCIRECNKTIGIIQNKIDNPSSVFSIDNTIFESIRALSEHIKKISDKTNDRIGEIIAILEQKETEAKSSIGQTLKNDQYAKKLYDDIKDDNKLLQENESVKKELTEQRVSLEQKSSTFKPFVDLANEALRSSGSTFRLEISKSKEHYCIHSINGTQDDQIIASDLSEGERRLLGFIYFMASLCESISKKGYKLKSNIQLILIDDPITSLDMDNRYYLTSAINDLIDDLASDKGVQLIITTHSSMDFHNIGYRKSSQISYFQITKNTDGHSEIHEVKGEHLKDFSNYYCSTLVELAQFASIKKEEIDAFQSAFQYANKMRFVLETHARTHYLMDNMTAKKQNLEIAQENYSIPNEEMDNFKEHLNLINNLSHGLSLVDEAVNEQSPKEVQISIRYLLCVMYRKDPQHILAMCRDVDNIKENLENWKHKYLKQ